MTIGHQKQHNGNVHENARTPQSGRAGVDLGEEQGEGAGDAPLAGPVQRHGDALRRVGDRAGDPADDRLAGDGPVLVVVVQVGVEVPAR